MIDFRVKVIGSAGKNDSLLVVLFHEFEGFGTKLIHVILELAIRTSAGSYGFSQLASGDIHIKKAVFSSVGFKFIDDIRVPDSVDIYLTLTREKLMQLFNHSVIIIIRQERMIELDSVVVEQLSHILVNYLRVCSNNRAVIMVCCSLVFYNLKVDARIEYPLNSILDKPFDMTVSDFSRIACSVR